MKKINVGSFIKFNNQTYIKRPTKTQISAICRNRIFCTFKMPNILPKQNILPST